LCIWAKNGGGEYDFGVEPSTISVVVVGRNDDHGYNLQKRVTTSLNSIASFLRAQDELIFVDWNSPSEYPVMPIAIWDSLTEHCRKVLKIIKVSESEHKLVKGDSERKLLEPIARNVGIRRAKNSSKWILSTNTDIVFIPTGFKNFAELCETLDERLWMCSRYELPEFIWESLDRKDVIRTQKILSALHAESALALSVRLRPFPDIDFDICDGVGDFQLATRAHWNAIGGFPEGMLLGWHVDTRATIAFNSVTNTKPRILLDEQLVMYHQNHQRTPTSYHSDAAVNPSGVANQPYLNQKSWGIAEKLLPEITLHENYLPKVQEFTERTKSICNSKFLKVLNGDSIALNVNYSLAHVFPFLIEELHSSYLGGKLGLVSINKRTIAAFKEFANSNPIELQTFDDHLFLDDLNFEGLDWLILDLGIEEEGMPKNVDEFESLRNGVGRLALTIPKLAKASQGKTTKFIFLRSQNWATRRLIRMFFNVPLFNNYSGILSGRVAAPTLISQQRKFKEYIFLGGITEDYGLPSLPLETTWYVGKLARLLRKAPKPVRVLMVKVAKNVLRIKF
jgi:hypothetical protein